MIISKLHPGRKIIEWVDGWLDGGREKTLSLSHGVLSGLLLFTALMFYCCWGLAKVKFHPDESQYIATSASFEAFIKADYSSSIWDLNYFAVNAPPLARYIIGSGRWLGGYGEIDLNEPWDFSRSAAYNKLNGYMPAEGLLWWSRLPMALIAAFVLFGSYIFLEKFSGKALGFLGLALLALNPFLLLTLRRAMSEAPLLLFLMVALLIGRKILTFPNDLKARSPYHLLYLFLIFGVCAGLAESSKLNGVTVLGGGFITAILVFLKLDKERTLKLRLLLLSILILIVSSQFTFLALNPFLWPDPLVRTKMLFDYRVLEMGVQFASYPASRIEGLLNHLVIPLKRIFQDYAALHFNGSLYLNVTLFIIGAAFLLAKSVQHLRKGGYHPAAPVLVIVGVTTSFPTLFTPLDWDRYFLLPIFFTTITIAIGAWQLAFYSIRMLRPKLSLMDKIKTLPLGNR